MNTRSRYSLALIAAIFWMVAIVLVYFWIHKPLTPPLAKALGGGLLDFFSVAVMVVISGGTGRMVIIRLHPGWSESLSREERFAAEALLGLGIMSVIIFAVGLIWLNAISMFVVLILLAGFSFSHLPGWLRDVRTWQREFDFDFQWGRGLTWFTGLNLAMALVMALAPPTKFDALTYHLNGAKLWVEAGKFESLPGNHFFGFPQLVNTLYAGHMALLMGRFTGAAALHWMIGVLLLLAVLGYGTRRFNRFVGMLAVGFLLAATSFWLAFGWTYVDLATAAFGMLAFIMLDEWRHENPGENDSHRLRYLILAGVFVGLAMSAKYNAVTYAASAGLFIMFYAWHRDGIAAMLRQGLIYGFVALVVMAPWLLRNLAFYDNPVYPLVTPVGEWDEFTEEWYTSIDRAPLRERPVLVAPILLSPTFLGVEGSEIFSATIGPVFLLLIPLLLLTWKQIDAMQRASLAGMLLIVLLMHVFWLYTAAISIYGAQIRFVYPMFGILAILSAASLDSLRTLPPEPLDFAWVMRTVIALILVLTAVDHIAGTRQKDDTETLEGTTLVSHFLESRSLDYLFGVLDKDEFLDEALGWHIVAMREVNRLPAGSRVLFLWETRSLYCDESEITCLEDSILHRWWHDRRSIDDGSAESILDAWRVGGITHILVGETGRDYEFGSNDFFTDDDVSEWDKLPPLLDVIWQGEDIYTLYTVPESESSQE